MPIDKNIDLVTRRAIGNDLREHYIGEVRKSDRAQQRRLAAAAHADLTATFPDGARRLSPADYRAAKGLLLRGLKGI
jgi:hypothetical protein